MLCWATFRHCHNCWLGCNTSIQINSLIHKNVVLSQQMKKNIYENKIEKRYGSFHLYVQLFMFVGEYHDYCLQDEWVLLFLSDVWGWFCGSVRPQPTDSGQFPLHLLVLGDSRHDGGLCLRGSIRYVHCLQTCDICSVIHFCILVELTKLDAFA